MIVEFKNFIAKCLRFLFTKKVKDFKQIPIIINNYNRLTCLQSLIDKLTDLGYNNIYIIDNKSSYEPLLSYYKTIPFKVFYLKKNIGSKAFWKSGIWFRFINSYYVLTDPDIIPVEKCPENFIAYFYETLQNHKKCHKVGFSLKLDDIPESFALKSEVINWESKFYNNEIADGLFKAPIDTTFALYRPFSKLGRRDGSTLMFRTAFPYQARHVTWYIDSDNLSEEEIYYLESISNRTHWARQINNNNN